MRLMWFNHIKHNFLKVSLILGLTFFAFNSFSQEVDTTKSILEQKHSPRKATLLSTLLPGAGQIYNKKWWKVPIVYAAIGGCLYFGIDNNSSYVSRFAELAYRTQTGQQRDPEYALYSDAQLTEEIDSHQKWRDNFFVFTGIAYILNIVDANVDAHFYSFDVSDNLSFTVKPYSGFSINNQMVSGVSLKLKFK